MAEDPIGFAGGDANLYAYVGNDPTNFSDPSGLIITDALDVISFGISLNDFRKCPGWRTGLLALADLGGAILPIVPAFGTIRHAANLVDGFVDIANGADNLADGARGVSNLAGGVRPRGSVANPRNLPFRDPDRIAGANKTLDGIDAGGPFPYKKDGGLFENNENLLPRGNYSEYTVDTPGLGHRGRRRIVIDEDSGRTFYTDDHYHNFVQIDPGGS